MKKEFSETDRGPRGKKGNWMTKEMMGKGRKKGIIWMK